LDRTFEEAMRNSNDGTLKMKDVQGKEINLRFSLNGFTRAMQKLKIEQEK